VRRVRYSVAMSLDGYIAGPDDEIGWLPTDIGVDWGAFMGRFDTVLMGRRTYEVSLRAGTAGAMGGMRTYVFSRTLEAGDHSGVTVVAEHAGEVVATLRREPGKEIWLMGGGHLAASLIEAGVVDLVEVAVVPIVLGKGLPFLPGLARATELTLSDVHQYQQGVVLLTYGISGART
jgi:dihydrofolate reductase